MRSAAPEIAGRASGQMDRACELARSGAEHARDLVELARDAGKSGLGEADRDGEKADHIGDDERGRRAREHESDARPDESRANALMPSSTRTSGERSPNASTVPGTA